MKSNAPSLRHGDPAGGAGSSLLAAALDYAGRGWHVLPCRPGGKAPLTAHGLDDASSDPELIFLWWCRWSDANVGIACARSGLVVVDLDGPDACARWETLQRRYGHVGAPLIASTGRGWHFVYRHPGGRLVGTLGDNIDVKANGYIVAPPSVHPSGHRYRWYRYGDPQPAPPWLVTLLRPPPPRPATPTRAPSRSDTGAYVAAVLARVATTPPGDGVAGTGRNNALYRAAYTLGRLVAAGDLDEARAAAELEGAAGASGLTAEDGPRSVKATISSGMNAGKANPRSLR